MYDKAVFLGDVTFYCPFALTDEEFWVLAVCDSTREHGFM